MNKTISITVKDKIATQANDVIYTCGNSDFIAAFDFDEEWNDFETKTARFKVKGKPPIDKIFSGNVCPVPQISDTYSFEVGVYAGDIHTTTPAIVYARKSILCGGGTPADPPDDVYNQIMERLNELGTPDPEAIAAAVADYIAANPITETDPTVPAWAKSKEKPEYTAEEVGAIAETELQTAINTALAQAKASGEFDGADGAPGKDGVDGQPGADGVDGYSPTANVTQNESGAIITITDKNGTTTATVTNGKDGADGSPGADGQPGADGSQGKDGADGKDGVSCTHSWDGTVLTVTSASGTSSADLKGDKGDKGDTGNTGPAGEKGDTGDTGPAGSDGKSAYTYAVESGYTGTEAEFAAKLAAEKVANPYALTFTGAATGSYDGSEALTVEIPNGGGGSSPKLLKDIVLTEDSSISITDFDNTLSEYLVIIGMTLADKLTTNLYFFGSLGSDYYLSVAAGNAVMSLYYRIFGDVMWMARDVYYLASVDNDFASMTLPPANPANHNNAYIRTGAYKIKNITNGLKSSAAFPAGTHIWIYGR